MQRLCQSVAESISKQYTPRTLIGIPRGGLIAAYALAPYFPECEVMSLGDRPRAVRPPTMFVDDVYVTGETMRQAVKHLDFNEAPMTAALIIRSGAENELSSYGAVEDRWVVFPWEVDEQHGPEDAVRRIIEYAGYDPSSPALKDTPRRVLAFYDEMRERREQEFNYTAFEMAYQDLVVVKDIPIFSLCEHHLLPFFGKAHVAYIPCIEPLRSKEEVRVLGLSKVARIVQQKSSGLATQERLSHEIASEVVVAAKTDTVAVVIEAEHTCMKIRGPRVDGAQTITSAMFGRFRDDATLRMELLSLLKS